MHLSSRPCGVLLLCLPPSALLLARIDFPANVRIFLLEKFAVTEERLAGGADETMQLSALIGAFKRAIALVEEPL